VLAEREERGAQIELEVDDLLVALPPGWQLREGAQCLLEAGDRVAIRAPSVRLGAGLTQVPAGPIPHSARRGVVGEAAQVLAQTVGVELLEGAQDEPMQPPTPGAGEATGRHLVGDRVLARGFPA